MTRASAVAAVLALTMPLLCLQADDGKPGDVKKTQSSSEPKAQAKKSEGAVLSPDQLTAILQDALKRIQSMSAEEAKSRGELRFPSRAMFAMSLSKELQADVVKAIGRAQAKVGDLPGARSSWQSALDAAAEISTFDAPADRAGLYVEVAKAQHEAGEKDEARLTLRQALQSARSIRAESSFPLEPPPGMEFDSDPLAKKATLLRQIAAAQAKASETAASQDTFRLAIEIAETMGQPSNKVRALLEIAQGVAAGDAKAVWVKALDFALAMKDEYPRAKAVEMVLRARLDTLPADETMAIIVDRLKGDLQNYALWVVADAVATSDKPFAPQVMTRLSQLAIKAEFDRPSKKLNVFERIAEAQARLGDYDGAYKTAGEPHPVNDVQTVRATRARMNVMKAVAEAQLKAKNPEAARDTVLAAMEVLGPLPDEDAEAYFPLAGLGSIQARAGDLSGALRTVEALSSSVWKVHILSEIALAHAEAGRLEDARKSIRLAFEAGRRAPNDMLWSLSSNSGAPQFAQSMDPMLPVLQTLAQTQARIGELDAALKTLADMSGSGFGKFARNNTIEQIVAARLDAGDVPGARRAVDVIPDSDAMFASEKAKLLERIAKKQAETGDPSSVLEWVGHQQVPDTKLKMLRGLADGIAQRLEPKETKAADASPPIKPAK